MSSTLEPATSVPRAVAPFMDLDDVPCPLCRSVERENSLAVRDHEYESTPRGDFTLWRCACCHLYYLSPRPALHELPKIYPPEYANYHTADDSPPDGSLSRLKRAVSVREISNRVQRRRWRQLLGLYTPVRGTSAPRILDVGCGDGHALNLLKDIIADAETVGVEFSAEAAAIAAKRHRVIVGDFGSAAIDGQFDLVVSSHVVEHVAEPIEFMRKIRSLVTKEGTVIIDTPNIDTPLFRLFGRHWGGLHAPRHWALFAEDTMRDLAERSGLRIKALIYMPIQIFWVWSLHSVLYERHRRIADRFFHPQCLREPSLYYSALLSLLQLLERGLWLFDRRMGQMRVVLERADR